jgi:hypothetical protein
VSGDVHHIVNKRMIDCQHNADGQYLFVNISKNASTSIRESIKFTGYSPYIDIKGVEDYIKFTVWRNPISRAVSSFYEIRDLRNDGPYYTTIRMKWYRERNLFKSFELFIDEINNNFYDAHAFPQITFLNDKGLDIGDMDEILLLETIQEDYDRLIKQYPSIVSNNLMHLQSHKNDTLMNYVYNNVDIKDKIINLYQEDYDIYLRLKEVNEFRNS